MESKIYPNVTIEDNVYIGPGCIIGYPAEHKLFRDKPQKGVVIKSGSYISAGVKIQAGTKHDTIIGQNCYIMTDVYIAHDCEIQDNVTISAGVKLAGHVTVLSDTNIGMGVEAHQYTTIPKGCMIGMGSVILKTTQLTAYGKFAGNPAKYIKPNK